MDSKQRMITRAIDLLKGCNKVLDLGCGTCGIIEQRDNIVGIDHNPETIKKLKKQKIKCYLENAINTKLKKESFDGIHCGHLIEHLMPNDAYKLIKEMDRLLKPNGILIIRSPMFTNSFYTDLSHIKPYPPHAILHYLTNDEQRSRNYPQIANNYKLLSLEYRYHKLKKIAYLLALRKVKKNE